ncbi:PorP/SprF family type IX secretion system membrane protein [Pedobacter sp.]
MKYLRHTYCLLSLIIVGANESNGQQRPQYTQYVFNNYLLNPALSGTENSVDVKLGHRMQWSGLKDAPQTSFVSAHWSLGSDYLWQNPLSLPRESDNPMSKSYMRHYTSSPAHYGVGVMAVSDRTGPISRIDAGMSYAYHLQLSGTNNLSVGTYIGLSRISLDENALDLETDGDPALSDVLATQFKPDASIGVWLYGARFFAGLSVQQVIPQVLAFTKSSNYKQGKTVPHFFATSGYKLFLDEEISLIPSFMLKGVSNLPLSVDLNVKLSYKDQIWIGGSYRKSDSFSGMVGFNLKRFANLTYAYDQTTSTLNRVSNGTHEIVLGIQIDGAYQVFSGGRTWR